MCFEFFKQGVPQPLRPVEDQKNLLLRTTTPLWSTWISVVNTRNPAGESVGLLVPGLNHIGALEKYAPFAL